MQSPERPEIEYPCTWTYQVIGSDEAGLRAAVAALLGAREHRLEAGQQSSGGKYSSVKLELEVADEGERNALFAALTEIAGVRLVL